MKFLSRQPSTLGRNLLAPGPGSGSPTLLKPSKTHALVAYFRTSSSTDDIPYQFDLTATYRRIPSPSPAVWNNFVGPNRANIVRKQGKYLKAFKTCNNNFDVHSTKEQVIEISLDKVVISEDLQILVEAQLYYINVEDFILPSYGNKGIAPMPFSSVQWKNLPFFQKNKKKGIDPISELTDLAKTLPFQKMIEEILLGLQFRCSVGIWRRNCYYLDKQGDQSFKIFDHFRDICRDLFKHPGFEIDDHFNKITAVWGVMCLCVKIRFYMSREMMPTHEDMQQLGTDDKAYTMLRQKTDAIIKAIQVLSDYYKSIKEENEKGPLIRTTKADS